jgi:hypothetical protein
MHRRSGWIWGGRIIAVVAVVGLAIYLLAVGLDKADKLAGALSLVVAVAALVAPYLLPSGQPSSAAPPGQAAASGPRQSVTDTVVGGNLTQAQDVGGIRVPGAATPATRPGTAPAAGPVPGAPGGQYVKGVWVGGNLTQIDGADGDVTLG